MGKELTEKMAVELLYDHREVKVCDQLRRLIWSSAYSDDHFMIKSKLYTNY